MRFVCRNFSVSDMPRRGHTPQDAPLMVLLLDLEADLSIWEQGREVWSERMFPVAELARWLRGPDAGRRDFVLHSMQAEDGLIRIARSDEGWRVGCDMDPDFWTSPVSWDVLVAEVERFDRSVRDGVAALGADPAFIPVP